MAVLADRLNRIIEGLIKMDQVRFLPMRQAPDNVQKILNIVNYINKEVLDS